MIEDLARWMERNPIFAFLALFGVVALLTWLGL